MGYLSRMTQWKVRGSLFLGLSDKVQSKMSLPTTSGLPDNYTTSTLKLGLFSYPVLQAADILVHGFGTTSIASY